MYTGDQMLDFVKEIGIRTERVNENDFFICEYTASCLIKFALLYAKIHEMCRIKNIT